MSGSRSRGEKGQARAENRTEKGQARAENRADKGQATPAQLSLPTPDVLDIIPSRLAESEWLSIMSQEEGEDIVSDLVEELLNGVMDKCYEVDIKKQVKYLSHRKLQYQLTCCTEGKMTCSHQCINA